MPNRKTHVRAGAVIGIVTAAYFAREAPTDQLFAEALGGLVGGYLGGMLPDLLEPATSPNHRQLAHSLVAGGTLALARVSEWQASCRYAAARAQERAVSLAQGSDERNNAELATLAWRLAAGVLVGLVAGYASHLALDAGTPAGLPLIAS